MIYQKLREKPVHPKALTGRIEVIAGCMFSGKSEELIRRLRRAKIARLNVAIFKPSIDDRYSKDEIVSHSANKLSSKVVSKAKDILIKSRNAHVVGIDEAQFFDEEIVAVCESLANEGKRVIVAGLDLDYKGKPFGSMPFLLAIADEVLKTQAVCMRSGLPATRTQRIAESDQLVLIGHTNMYEARHRAYFSIND